MSVSRRFFLMGSLALPAVAAKKPAPVRPGIVLALVDELPAWILGAYGNKQVRTPNLDLLSQLGMRFTNHFTCAPAPAAGRNCLLTGLTPMQLGGGDRAAADATLAKILEAGGYASQEGDASAALRFLDQQSAGKPFLFTWNCASLRPPYDGVPQKYADLYAGEPFNGYAPDLPSPQAQEGKEMLRNVLSNVRKAAAAVSALDADMGAIMSKLRARQMLDSTMVIFTSACGALWGRHGLWDSGEASDPINMYDEAVRTPIIWSWRGHVPAIAQRPEPLSSFDFVPTLCELLSIDPPKRNLGGRSYAALLTGRPLPKKAPWRLTVCSRLKNTGMARQERYKLVRRNDGKGPNELYDLTTDAGERVNQFDNPQYVTVRTELADELTRWEQRYSSQEIPPAPPKQGRKKGKK